MLILASASPARRAMLEQAGLDFAVEPAAVDEAAVKADLAARGASAREVALALAEAKAVQVAERRPRALVIGADQMLVCDGEWFDKPADRDAARRQLRRLRGRRHSLLSAVALARGGDVLWRHDEAAALTMRAFSESFLEDYLERSGDEVLASVGAYRLEGLGAQLFARVEGDHFTILGLPLLPLLEALRGEGVLAS